MEITMKYILDKFNYCNKFSLSSSLPITKIPSNDKKNLLEQNLQNEKESLSQYYQHFSKKENIVVDFETLYNDIVKECRKFYKKIQGKDITTLLNNDSSPFIADHVGKDTKYSEPISLIWHFYHNIQQVFMSNDALSNMLEIDKFNIDDIVTKEKDVSLKNNFLKYEYTFTTHCTKGPLQLVLYFNLNDDTKKWLLQFKDDFDLGNSEFEDLAFYDNNKLKFSSCTHEGFNSLETSKYISKSEINNIFNFFC